jgi:hypothetical protein
MTTRLNQSIRDRILSNAVRDAFKDIDAKLKDQEHALGERIVKETWGKHYETARNMPESLMNWAKDVRANIGGMHAALHLKESMPVPESLRFNTYAQRKAFAGDTKIADAWHELTQAQRQAIKDREDLTCELRASLKSVSTVKQLLEVWPDARLYLPEIATPKLPAVSFENVSAKIEKLKEAA